MMLIFCGNKILVNNNRYDFDEEYISHFDVIQSSKALPENWQTLSNWVECENITDENLVNLRELWHIAGDEAFTKASGALQFMSWFRNVKLCSSCGGKLIPNSHDFGRKCEDCGKIFYAPISPAVITAVERDGKLLLAHNAAWPDNRYSIIAGFVEPGERLEEAVKREIHEEVALDVDEIKYFGSQTWPFPNSLMLGFNAKYSSGEIKPDGTEITHAGFFAPEEINNMNIPDKASIARKLIDNFLNTH
ncbi:MAG: NAD(+) diphosphatase [Synergistaceae bacterium]|nr:NAD(+) diphosphatase [Synergistaceae bacterium]